MSGVATSWAQVAIGEVAQIVGGGTPPSKDEKCFALPGKGIAWLTPADLSGYKLQSIGRGSRDLSPIGLATCSAKVMPAGTVLFSSRAPIGYVAIASNPVATNQGFKSFVFPEGIDVRFAYYQLRHIKPTAEALATGTTFKELSGAAASRLPFLVAPKSEQKRIADKLDTVLTRVDAVNTRLARVAPILKRFRQSVLAAATSGGFTGDSLDKPCSHAWRETELGLVSIKITDGEHLTPRRSPSGNYLLSARNVRDGSIALMDVDHVDDSEFKRLRQRCDPSIGDVLLSCSGSVGRVALVDKNDAYVMVRSAAMIRPDPAILMPEFLMYALQSPSLQQQILNASRATAQANIFLGPIKRLVVRFPEIAEQVEIVRRVETLFAFADRLEARLQTARTATERLTPALLAKAFRGELVPQDPADEPASELLKRLAASASALAPKRGRRQASDAVASTPMRVQPEPHPNAQP